MALLITEDNFDNVNNIIKESTDNKKKKYYIEGIFLQAEQKNRNGRIYPSHILEREVNRFDRDYIQKNRALGELNHPECKIYRDFEILTPDRGWVMFDDINVGDSVYSMDKDGVLVIDIVLRKIEEKNNGIAYKIKGRNIDTVVTPNHRFYLYNRNNDIEISTIEDIYNNPSYYNKCKIIKNTIDYIGNDLEYITIPAVKCIKSDYKSRYKQKVWEDLKIPTSLFVKFLGIWLAEGHISKEKNTVYITQADGNVFDDIVKLYDDIGFDYNIIENKNYYGTNIKVISFSDKRIHSYLSNFGKCYDKFIPSEIKNLDKKYLFELIHWFGKGDGRKVINGSVCKKGKLLNIFSTSKQLIDDFQECAIKCGIGGNIITIIPDKDTIIEDRIIKKENKHSLYVLNLSYVKGIWLDRRHPFNIEKINISDGGAYCIETHNGNFYNRENGKIHLTGNSPSVNAERACHLIKELKKVGNDWYGKSLVTSEGLGKIVRGLMEDGVQLGVSSRGLGTLTKKEDAAYVNEDFYMATIDVVSDPSAPGAWVNGIYEGKEFYVDENTEEFVSRVKKEIDKEARKVGFSLVEEHIILNKFNEMLRSI